MVPVGQLRAFFSVFPYRHRYQHRIKPSMGLNEPLAIMMRPPEADHFTECVSRCTENAAFVEWGCGGSTLRFSELMKPNQQLWSIEHTTEWYAKVTEALVECWNITVFHLPEDMDAARAFACVSEENPAGLMAYLNPPVEWSRVELVLVDGIARGACLAQVVDKAPSGTTVLLHDYVGREKWYDWAISGPRWTRVKLTDTLLELRTI